MEARYKPKKVVETSISKKPRELVKRKTLRHNYRPPTEKKRDLPPLTPLHRLKRFQAIRDKNLKNKLRKTLSQNIFLKKMEESGSVTVKISEKETGITNSDSVVVCQLKPTLEEAVLESQNCELVMNGQNGHKETKEKISNGHELVDVEKENPVDTAESTKELILNGNENVSQSFEDAQEEVNVSKTDEVSDVNKTKNKSKESNEEAYKDGQENFPESDRESTASSSTFTSNKEFLQSSSDEMLEALPGKTESADEDEEVDIDRISSTEDETKSSYTNKREGLEQKKNEIRKEETEKEAHTIESKKSSYQSRIPRSLSSVSSASSYKSAYGSLSRISGRRPVMARGRKRPAEDDSSERRASFSEPSPRWRFVRAVPGLWSTPNLPSPSNKCFRKIDDSMVVNVNEDSINYNLNDPDLFSDSKEIPPSKRSRWGCGIM